MSNTYPERQLNEDAVDPTTPSEKANNAESHNEPQHRLRTKKTSPFNGIRQYTSQLSPKLANPGYIARSRQIYDNICPDLSKNHPGWYVVIEPDSGDYFLNVDKDLAKNEARQKHPKRLFCAFKLITSGV
ncbi:MAG: hypothetical protein KME64_00375 [Scytonematopsis contorta HA4267-MV1]|jgi:hypothetical protein|nr:hypothetical protein [Scytonematopsis contorta HA4267-MV1]